MKNFLMSMTRLSVCSILMLTPSALLAQTSVYWIGGGADNKWTTTGNWSTTGPGGVSCSCIPSATEKAVFGGVGANANNPCIIDVPVTVSGITVNNLYTSTITLNNDLTTQGNNMFGTGALSGSGKLILSAPVATETTFSSGFVADVQITGSTGKLFLNGATFNKVFSVIKTVNSNDLGTGGNVFLADVSIENASNGGNLILADGANPDRFGGALTLKVSHSNATISMSHTATAGLGTEFHGTVSLIYAAPGIIYFGANNGKSKLVNVDVSVVCGVSGCGNLALTNFTGGTGAATLDLTPNGSTIATLTLGPECNFAGSLTAKAPSVLMNGVTCTGASTLIHKTGTSNDASTGNNNLGGTVTSIVNGGNGDLIMGNVTRDIFGELNITNGLSGGAGRIFMANGSLNNEFNGDIRLNSPNVSLPAGKGIYFSKCVSGCSSILANGKTIIEASEMVAGILHLQNFTTGTGGITLDLTTANLTGNALYLGPGNNFGGDINMKASRIFLNGNTFGGSTYLEKNGAGNDEGSGGNTFMGTTEIVNKGDISNNNDGALRTNGNNTFNGPVTVINESILDVILELNATQTSTYNAAATFINRNNDSGFSFDLIEVAYAGTTTFMADVTVQNYNLGDGIYFCRNGGTTQAVFAGGAGLNANAGTFTTGTLHIQNIDQNGIGASNDLSIASGTLKAGPNVDFEGAVDFRAPRLLLNGGVYRGLATFEKTVPLTSDDDVDDLGSGNNTFHGITLLQNSSNKAMRTRGNNTFNASVTLRNTGAGSISLEHDAAQTSSYNANIFVHNAGAANSHIQVGFGGTTTIDSDVSVQSTGAPGSYGIYFGDEASAGGGGSVLLKDMRSLSTLVYTVGELRLIRFIQEGSTDQTLLLNDNSILRVGPFTTFNGDVNFSAPAVFLNGFVLNGPDNTSVITKTGTSSDLGKGGNVFNTDVTLANSGNVINAVLATAAVVSGAADTFNGNLTLNNSNVGSIWISDRISGTSFNQNIIINGTGTGGILIGANGGASTLASTKTVSGTSTNGTIQLSNFTQLGNTAQNFSFTGAAIVSLGPFTTFHGAVDFTAPGIILNGATYKANTLLHKTGSSNNSGSGNNIFEALTTIMNSGSGEFRTANTTRDVFAEDVTLTNTSTGYISVAFNNNTATEFRKNVIFNSTNSGSLSGIYIGGGGGVGATVADGSLLQVGGTGVTAGKIALYRVQQPAGVTTGQSLTLSGTATLSVGLLSGGIRQSHFRGDVNFSAPGILLNGCTYEGTNIFIKTGSTADAGTGGNWFTGGGAGSGYSRTTTFQNAAGASNYWAFSFPGPGDQFDGPLIIDKQGPGNIQLSHNVSGTATAFNNTVTINASAGSGGFITIGTSGGTGYTSTVSAPGVVTPTGGQITMGSVADGTIVYLTRMDISGDQIINSTTGELRLGYSGTGCRFNNNLSINQRRLLLESSIFNGDATTIEKTGTLSTDDDLSPGGNTFGDEATDVIVIRSSGAGTFRLAQTTGDTFYGMVTFERSAGTLQPATNGTSTFYNDVTINSSATVTFGSGTGNVTFAGGAVQSLNRPAGSTPIFRRIRMNKSGGSLMLNTMITVATSLAFDYDGSASNPGGIIYTTNANYINITNAVTDASVTGASSTSHVDGPVRKTGNQAFTFPTGDGGKFKPISMSAPSVGTDHFTAEYFYSSPSNRTSRDASLSQISDCEYWMFDRTGGTSIVNVTLPWISSDCANYTVTSLTDLNVVQWDGTIWGNYGNSGTTGTSSSGTVTSNFALTTYGPVTLGSGGNTLLPVTLVSFVAQRAGQFSAILTWTTASEWNHRRFEIEKSVDAKQFQKIGEVQGIGTTHSLNNYTFTDEALTQRSYYRLRQVDIDGSSTVTGLRVVYYEDNANAMAVFPNPSDGDIRIMIASDHSMDQNMSMTLWDASGAVICRIEGPLQMINESVRAKLRNAASGIYFLQVVTGQSRYLSRIIRQ